MTAHRQALGALGNGLLTEDVRKAWLPFGSVHRRGERLYRAGAKYLAKGEKAWGHAYSHQISGQRATLSLPDQAPREVFVFRMKVAYDSRRVDAGGLRRRREKRRRTMRMTRKRLLPNLCASLAPPTCETKMQRRGRCTKPYVVLLGTECLLQSCVPRRAPYSHLSRPTMYIIRSPPAQSLILAILEMDSTLSRRIAVAAMGFTPCHPLSTHHRPHLATPRPVLTVALGRMQFCKDCLTWRFLLSIHRMHLSLLGKVLCPVVRVGQKQLDNQVVRPAAVMRTDCSLATYSKVIPIVL